MWNKLFLVMCILTPSLAIWQCATDSDCATLSGSACAAGECVCTPTQQIVAAGTLCADYAPYYTSTCHDDFQCSRLFTAFQCRRNDGQTAGNCFCQPHHHYFQGRCWPSIELHAPCSRDEECMGVIRDPHSMTCNQTCQCADGYYSRQRGECRRIGATVGERCVLNEDCQFEHGTCDQSFVCYDSSIPVEVPEVPEEPEPSLLPRSIPAQNITHKIASKMTARQNGAPCSFNDPCPAPFVCSHWGQCVCPTGYYGIGDGSNCYAELGSPSTEEQCVGLLAEVLDGVCTCPANFFYGENMRDCVKVARTINDFCTSDDQCHTFGAAVFCGEPGQWGVRSCQCDLEHAVWDQQRSMCRLFAGIGEACEVDSDCMAGELEIQCALNEDGEGYCGCPDGLDAFEGLCVTSGLELGDSCQLTLECTGTANTVCEDGQCSCDNGYQEVDDFCAPIIGGTCTADVDCVINNTVCVSGDTGLTCQCRQDYIEYSDECWEISDSYNASCSVDAQCLEALGTNGACVDGACLCGSSAHYRDGACWPVTGLFEGCSRSSQCYLGELTDTVVCRNGLCQCDFAYPYSEELHTCTSTANVLTSSSILLLTSMAYILT